MLSNELKEQLKQKPLHQLFERKGITDSQIFRTLDY